MKDVKLGAVGKAFLLAVFALTGCTRPKPLTPLYDASSPIIYDNDEVVDVYTDEYLLALVSLGEIQLKGMITSSSIAPENRWVTAEHYEKIVNDRSQVVAAARASGFQNLPDPIRGPKGHLQKPASGKIEETPPLGTDGSKLIVAEAKKATVEKPLVVVVGGPLTAEADAYLLDSSIADKVLVAWVCGRRHNMGGYNGWVDGWAAYIVLQKLRLVHFGEVPSPEVRKADLFQLPPSPLRDFMYHSYLNATPPGPGEVDGDAPPAIGLRRPEYVLKTRAVSFGQWIMEDNHELPAFRRNLLIGLVYRLLDISDRGRSTVVKEADAAVASEEWWRAMRQALHVEAAK